MTEECNRTFTMAVINFYSASTRPMPRTPPPAFGRITMVVDVTSWGRSPVSSVITELNHIDQPFPTGVDCVCFLKSFCPPLFEVVNAHRRRPWGLASREVSQDRRSNFLLRRLRIRNIKYLHKYWVWCALERHERLQVLSFQWNGFKFTSRRSLCSRHGPGCPRGRTGQCTEAGRLASERSRPNTFCNADCWSTKLQVLYEMHALRAHAFRRGWEA